jgi:hypothetical protein
MRSPSDAHGRSRERSDCYSFRGSGSDGGKAWVERKARLCGGSSKARARLAEVFAVGPLAQV